MKVQSIFVIARTDCYKADFSDTFGHKIEGNFDAEQFDEK